MSILFDPEFQEPDGPRLTSPETDVASGGSAWKTAPGPSAASLNERDLGIRAGHSHRRPLVRRPAGRA